MSDEIETIDRNPKSWAAWKREAESLQEIIDGMELAAMDSEPVQMFGIGSIFKPQRVIEQEADCDDCAHYNPKICHGEGCPAISQQSAQPAPVVPEEWTISDAVKFCKETGRQDAGAAMDAWNACRAAMLNGDKK